jgi:hypothetical protein
MDPRAEHRLKQFIDTWNELAHRSTTMSDDLHVIIANLLDFNVDRIMSISTREERMKATILSFDLLPVSLFWNSGPKIRDEYSFDVNYHNRWIPVEPSKTEMIISPVMQVSEEWLPIDLHPLDGLRSIEAYLLHSSLPDGGRTSFFCAGPGAPAILHSVSLLGAHAEEHLSRTFVGYTYYLIIEPASASPNLGSRKGAICARMPRSSEDEKGQILLTYCCTVALEIDTNDQMQVELAVRAQALPTTPKVAVRFGKLSHCSQT